MQRDLETLEPVLNTLKRDLHVIDQNSDGCISQADVNAFIAKPHKSNEDQVLATFLHDHYGDILRLTDAGAIGQDAIARFEDILKYKQGPGAGAFSVPAAIGGAAIGSAAMVGLGHLVMKATDSYGRDKRNHEREHIYRELHAKIEE